jgi:hypothetical protein
VVSQSTDGRHTVTPRSCHLHAPSCTNSWRRLVLAAASCRRLVRPACLSRFDRLVSDHASVLHDVGGSRETGEGRREAYPEGVRPCERISRRCIGACPSQFDGLTVDVWRERFDAQSTGSTLDPIKATSFSKSSRQ